MPTWTTRAQDQRDLRGSLRAAHSRSSRPVQDHGRPPPGGVWRPRVHAFTHMARSYLLFATMRFQIDDGALLDLERYNLFNVSYGGDGTPTYPQSRTTMQPMSWLGSWTRGRSSNARRST